ncbi:MAG: sulfurtransferase TusA family protein [Rhodocyclaceae bacterium]|nr:sulfurtransferase TusA family protein [Rhodocyclaceae bacterium]
MDISITLDLSGLPCPAPLVGAKKLLDDLAPGQSLVLISDCAGTRDDLLAWCRITGHELAEETPQEGGKTAYRIRKMATCTARPAFQASLDMRGIACPGPIIEARRLLEALQSGETLLLVSDCSAAFDDIRAWSQASDRIELVATYPASRGAIEFYLRRR